MTVFSTAEAPRPQQQHLINRLFSLKHTHKDTHKGILYTPSHTFKAHTHTDTHTLTHTHVDTVSQNLPLHIAARVGFGVLVKSEWALEVNYCL